MATTADIITYNSELWLSQRYLQREVGVGDGYLRAASSRAAAGELRSWEHAAMLNTRYFKYVSLPPGVAKKVGAYSVLLQQSTPVQSDAAAIVREAVSEGYRQFLRPGQGDDAARAEAVVHAAVRHVRGHGISYRKSPFFRALADEVKAHHVKYLPVHWRNLRDKIKACDSGAGSAPAVTVKNVGNQHRSLVKEGSEVMEWLVQLGISERNYSAATIHRKLALMCAQNGVARLPSERWVSGWLRRPATQLLVSERYGHGSRFNHKYRAYTPTQSALYAGDCWDIDGTRVNIVDHAVTLTDKDGRQRRVSKFLYIVVVRDVMSGLPLGWEYCHEESEGAVTNALAAAVRYAGYLPYELRYDRFPGHNTQGWRQLEDDLRRRGVVMSQTVKAEGKARHERWFGTLQDVFMADSALYYGEGIKSTRRYAHRSKEYVSKMRQWALRNGFSFDDACRETDSILERHNATPYSAYSAKYRHVAQSPSQLHEESAKPNTFDVDAPTFCYLFGLRRSLSIRNNLIQAQVDGAPYYYAIDDCEVIERYTGVKLTACFDCESYEQVHLYDGERHVGTFERLTPAQQYGPDKDMRAVGKLKAIAAKVAAHKAQRLAEATGGAAIAEEVELSPELGTLLAGRIKKQQAEAAETALLHEELRPLRDEWEDDDEGGTIIVDITKSY